MSRVRDRRFRRGEPSQRWWAGGDPVAIAFFNALSVRAHRDSAPALDREIRDFIAQEVNHSHEHLASSRAVTGAGAQAATSASRDLSSPSPPTESPGSWRASAASASSASS